MRGRGAGPLVWGVWAVLSGAAVAFVGAFGRDCPFIDEWRFLGPLAGEPGWAGWLVEAHVEHRYPVPRAAYLGLYRLAGDLRAAMLANATGTAAAAAVYLLALRRARGRTAAADLFVPLALLHPGHWENGLMAYQLNFVGMVLLTAAAAAVSVRSPAGWGWGRVLTAGGVAVLLPGFGAYGLVFGAAWSGWLLVAAGVWVRSRGKRAALAALAGLAAAGVLAVVATQPAGAFAAVARGPWQLAGFAAALTAVTFGPGVALAWPLAAAVVAGVAVAAWAAVGRRALAGDAVGFGLGALLAAAVGVTAGLTWGRGWAGLEAGFTSRYAAVIAGFGCLLLVAAVRCGGPRLARLGPGLFAVAAAVAWPFNALDGLAQARRVSGRMDALAADVRDGLPDALLVERHNWQLWVADPTGPTLFPEVRRWPAFAPFPATGPTRLEPTAVRPSIDGPARRLPLPGRADLLAVRVVGQYRPPMNRMADVRAGGERWQVPANGPFPLVVRVPAGATELVLWPGVPPDRYEVLAVDWVCR